MGLRDSSEVDLLLVRRRLAEAIAWCAARAGAGEPGDALWTPALRPPWAAMPAASRPLFPPPGPLANADLRDFPLHERAHVVEELARNRAAALAAEGRAPTAPADGLAGGRLVISEDDDSVDDGASEHASRGFFDAVDTPPWDTWVCYVVDPAVIAANERRRAGSSQEPYGYGRYLVSWVPPAYLHLVAEGIRANPVDCIAWAESVDTALTRRLRAAAIM
jgi:hypothetical protein